MDATRRARPRLVATVATLAALVAGGVLDSTSSSGRSTFPPAVFRDVLEGRSLDGSGNHEDDPALGQAGRPYVRVADADYADGIGAMVDGPSPRAVSNRIFNDLGQNVFSERGISHWGFVWGQFLDHTFGQRQEGDEDAPLAFDATDPLERFTNDLGGLAFTRSAMAEGTGVTSPRQQVNLLGSYIDASPVYGETPERLDWLRAGPVDGDPSNNDPHLLTDDDGYLPTQADRPDDPAPEMDLFARQMGDPSSAVIAGDTRANENIGLTAVQTLFVREHNRIVDALPDRLPDELKFAIARRVVGAEEQWITYTQFLPAMGVPLPRYKGYDESVDPSISDEFATVGYRAHSQIHGEFETDVPVDELGADGIEGLEAQGVEATIVDDDAELAIPLNVAFGNPGLIEQIGLGHVLAGLASEREYANDELIDDQLRSVLFEVPGPDVADPSSCLDGPPLPGCFAGVTDLGAVDLARGRDHGMPTYNEMRIAYGLAPATSFTDVTGEDTAAFPSDRALDPADPMDDPDVIGYTSITDAEGNELAPGSDEADTTTVHVERRTTLASRLQALYGDVDHLEAFVGMMAEPHVAGSEMGELQRAMWIRQFTALRDGDRFFYGNDPVLRLIRGWFGIDHRVTLAQLIAQDTGIPADQLPEDVFFAPATDEEAPSDEAPSADDDSTTTTTAPTGITGAPAPDPTSTTPSATTPEATVPEGATSTTAPEAPSSTDPSTSAPSDTSDPSSTVPVPTVTRRSDGAGTRRST
jgi:hypothetical protein